MSIRIKLFAILLAVSLSLVGGMYGFMRWSLDNGFNRFMANKHEEQVQNLLETLGDYYAAERSWQSLRDDRWQWLELLWRANRHFRPPPELRLIIKRGTQPWPPQLPEHDQEFVPFELRVMLLGIDRQPLIGRPELVAGAELRPIAFQGQTVGFLAVLPGKPVMLPLEQQFFDRQNRTFFIIALSMLLPSAALALLLAYLLGKPLKHVATVIRRLADGDYQPRITIHTKDELGRLANDINHLAKTLQHTETSRRQWVADISHELRTPLAVLRAELEALQDGIRPLTPDAVDLLLDDVERLSRLTDDLYQLALSDQNAFSYRKKPLDAVALLRNILLSLQHDFEQKHIALSLQEPMPEGTQVQADTDRLMQVFRNILNNSLNYTDPGGQVTIACLAKQGRLWLEFCDSAPGVADQDMAKLFDRFYRVEASRNRNHGGAGLGLALCRSIIAAHGGEIYAGSSPLGGLKITIVLPLASGQVS